MEGQTNSFPCAPCLLACLANRLPLFSEKSNSKIKIKDIKTLDKAEKFDITFFESLIYKDLAEKTKASCCITKESLKKYLPKSCVAICVKSVLFELAKIASKFYPSADLDYPDISLKKPNKFIYLLQITLTTRLS